MNTINVLLAAAALIPAIVLFVYIYVKDRVEKEPLWLLLLLAIVGAICTVPAGLLERSAGQVILNMFSGSLVVVEDQLAFTSYSSYYSYHFINNFFGIALIEEGLKWLALILLTRKNKNFNCFFDGLVYAVFVSLGFAAAENLLYVFANGFETAAIRAVTAIPGHFFDAVLMGYYYSLQRLADYSHDYETEMIKEGLISKSDESLQTKKYLALSLIVPVLAHGFYDFTCSVHSVFFTVLFYAFLVFLYIVCFKKVRKMSRSDSTHINYAKSIVKNLHPELKEFPEEK